MSQNPKRSIDRLRTGPGQMEIRAPDDESPITGMVTTSKNLFIVKEKGIYQVIMADDIDPERKNPRIRNTFQKIINYGSNSDFIGRTILTAKSLVKDKFLSPNIDCNKVMDTVFSATKDIAAAKDIIQSVQSEQDKIVKDVESRPITGLPSLSHLDARIKEFIQKLDHSAEALFQIARLFNPNEPFPKWFSGIHIFAEREYGADAMFTKFLGATLPTVHFIRNCRHCVEHRKNDQRLIITDFALDSDGQLNLPSLEVVHAETPQDKISVTSFMDQMLEHFVSLFEGMLAHLSAKRVGEREFPVVFVGEIPENLRREKNVRFGFLIQFGDQTVPIG